MYQKNILLALISTTSLFCAQQADLTRIAKKIPALVEQCSPEELKLILASQFCTLSLSAININGKPITEFIASGSKDITVNQEQLQVITAMSSSQIKDIPENVVQNLASWARTFAKNIAKNPSTPIDQLLVASIPACKRSMSEGEHGSTEDGEECQTALLLMQGFLQIATMKEQQMAAQKVRSFGGLDLGSTSGGFSRREPQGFPLRQLSKRTPGKESRPYRRSPKL